mgnify:CR=1 FL=1
MQETKPTTIKSAIAAGLLGLFLGQFGAHALDEPPDTVSHHDEIGDSSEEAKDGRNETDAAVL